MKALYLLFLLFITPLSAQEVQISVLTCGPGEELYSTFGHTAFRVQYPKYNIDRVYNYGMFDFQTPGFYTKFVRGKLPYMLGAYDYSKFYRSYAYEGRFIKEQVLNLNDQEKQNIINYLNNNAKVENRYYMYDFFRDNCATKIAEVLEKNIDRELKYNFSYYKESDTYRKLLHEKLENSPWEKFGIDLALGSIIDKELSPQDYQFLPDYLMLSLENSSVAGKPKTLLESRENSNTPSTISNPNVLFWGIFVLGLLWTYFSLSSKLFDWLLYGSAAIAGLLLLFLWFGTDHYATKLNWNVLWLNPFLLYAWLKRKDVLVHIAIGILILPLILNVSGYQVLPEGAILIIATLAIRLINQSSYSKFIPRNTKTR